MLLHGCLQNCRTGFPATYGEVAAEDMRSMGPALHKEISTCGPHLPEVLEDVSAQEDNEGQGRRQLLLPGLVILAGGVGRQPQRSSWRNTTRRRRSISRPCGQYPPGLPRMRYWPRPAASTSTCWYAGRTGHEPRGMNTRHSRTARPPSVWTTAALCTLTSCCPLRVTELIDCLPCFGWIFGRIDSTRE